MPSRGGRAAASASSVVSSVLLLVLVLLLVQPCPVVEAAGKHACEYSTPLCKWNAAVSQGAAVFGTKVFYQGGVQANAPGPVNSSSLEVLDLETLSSLVVESQHANASNMSLVSCRYGHLLASYKDKLLLLGGKIETQSGQAKEDASVLAFDLSNRTWSHYLQLTDRDEFYSERLFEAVTVTGNTLTAVVQQLSSSDFSRLLLTVDLVTHRAHNISLPVSNNSVEMLDWRLVGLLSGPQLVVTAKRQMPTANRTNIQWFVVEGGAGRKERALEVPCAASSRFKQAKRPPGAASSGAEVLVLKLMHLHRKPVLVMLARSTGTFASSLSSSQQVVVLLVFSINLGSGSPPGSSGRTVSLQLQHLLLTPPLDQQLPQLQSVDLPLLGHVAVGGRDVQALPCVGDLELVGPLDNTNANIQETGNGFVIRGLGRADQSCQPGADWRPFILHAVFPPNGTAGRPTITARSNYTWCHQESRAAQGVLGQVVSDIASLSTNGQLLRVETKAGPQLMLLGPQTRPNAGLHPEFFAWNDAPLMGVYLSLERNQVVNFTAVPDKTYSRPAPARVASCVSTLNGRPLFVEAGGATFDDTLFEYGMSQGLYTMEVLAGTTSANGTAGGQQQQQQQHYLKLAAGSEKIPARAQAALACGPNGQVWMFGGVDATGDKSKPSYLPSDELLSMTVGSSSIKGAGSSAEQGTRLSAHAALKPAGPRPSARSGHALIYLSPAQAAAAGRDFKRGALLLFGGSGVKALSLNAVRDSNVDSTLFKPLNSTTWDPALWAYDIAAGAWSKLDTPDTKMPALMYHSMTLAGTQVVVFGGQEFNNTNRVQPIHQSRDIHILDLSVSPLRWRKAPVTNIRSYGFDQVAFPCVSAASMPEQKVIALKYFKELHIVPIPQTMQLPPTAQALHDWGVTSINITAGDWVRLVVPADNPRVTLEQPLMLAGDVLFTGAVTQGKAWRGQAPAAPILQCAQRGNSSAIAIRSAGVQVQHFTIQGCKHTAVEASTTDAAVVGSRELSSAGQVKLTDVTFTGNSAAALRVGSGVSLRLRNCVFMRNAAGLSVVEADSDSNLQVVNCTFASNNGTALGFSGQQLLIEDSTFVDNRANNTYSSASIARAASCKQPLGSSSSRGGPFIFSGREELDALEGTGSAEAVNAGALRILCNQTACSASVVNSTFSRNEGAAGGAVFVGSRVNISMQRCTFTANAAKWLGGGAVFAYRDSCLQLTDSTFTDNGRPCNRDAASTGAGPIHDGGALFLQNPSCDIRWRGNTFTNNWAGKDGGALYIQDLTARDVLLDRCTFSNNQALSGSGGALALHTISSNVNLSLSVLTNNTAREGGGIHIHSSSSAVQLIRCRASGNEAAGGALATTSADTNFLAHAAHHGGVLSMTGSNSELLLQGCSFDANRAQGQGGAVFVEGSGSDFADKASGMKVQVLGSNFTANTALRSGAGLHVANSQLHMQGARLMQNAVNVTRATPLLYAAGGGVFCSECDASISRSLLRDNSAALGGAAALPLAQRVIVEAAVFEHNRAVQLGPAADVAAAVGSSISGSDGSSQYEGRGVGGAGLYLEAINASLSNLTFINNTASSAGGIYLHLRRSSDSSNSSLFNVQLQPLGDASAGTASNGLLLDGPMSRVLVPQRCEDPASRAHASCVAAAIADWQQLANRRRLLQAPASDGLAPAAASAAAGDETLAAAAHNLFATTAVKAVLVRQTVDGQWKVLNSSLARPLTASGDKPFEQITVQLQDALGLALGADNSDASASVIAKVFKQRLPGVQVHDIQMISNVSNAENGVAVFRELRVFPPKQNVGALELVFDSARGLEEPLRLALITQCKGCMPGQRTVWRSTSAAACCASSDGSNATRGPCSLPFDCVSCTSPTYSFIPEAEECSVCPARSVCNAHYVIPSNGMYQGHPRSPLIHDCLLPQACKRTPQQQEELLTVAEQLVVKPTVDITAEDVERYARAMCSKGYEGPLCGACEPSYGRAGTGCAACFKPEVHAALFVVVGLVMLAWVVFQGCLHVAQVNRNHEEIKQQALAALCSNIGSQQGSNMLPFIPQASQLPSSPQLQQSQQQQYSQQQLQPGWSSLMLQQQQMPLAELQSLAHAMPKSPQQSPSHAAALSAHGDDVQRQADTNQSLHMHQQQHQHQHTQQPAVQMPARLWASDRQLSLDAVAGGRVDSSSSRPDSLTMTSPWAVTGAIDQDMAQRLASDGSSGQGGGGSSSGGGQGARAPPPLFTQQGGLVGPYTAAELARLASIRRNHSLANQAVVPYPSATSTYRPSRHSGLSAAAAAAAVAAAGPLQSNSNSQQAAQPMTTQGGPQQPPPNGSSSSSGMNGAGSIGLQLRSMVSSLFDTELLHDASKARPRAFDATLQQQQQQQPQKGQPAQGQQQQQQQPGAGHTWIADMFKLLTSHLQLLGLLRPLRIKWPAVLQQLLEHMDPSSALMAWARLDCSMVEAGADGGGAVRRSIKRSIILLLSPVVAVAAVTLLWGVWATWVTWRAVRRGTHQRGDIRKHLVPHLVLYNVLVLFFLFPQVSKEIVSTLSCHPVDSEAAFLAAVPKKCDRCVMEEAMLALRYTGSYWALDTHVECWHGQHLFVVVLGALGLVFFAIGLPVSLFVVLSKVKDRLQSKEVELKLGFLYASYRTRYYAWEGVSLLQKLAMVVCITLLQGVSVGLQVLCAIGVVFISASLQVTFQPFACKLLDTLQRISFYSLETTLFLLMVASFDEVASDAARIALLVAVAVLNAAVLVLFVFFIGRDVKRMLVQLQRGRPLNWSGVGSWWRDKVADQEWIDAVTGKCEGCFRVREGATSSPVNGGPPAAGAAGTAVPSTRLQ